jgi:glycosyltransferase involved in cell wall biosynthesis
MKTRKKVLFVTSSLNLGGAERQLLLLCEKIESDVEVQLVCLESDGPLKEKYLEAFPDTLFIVRSNGIAQLIQLRNVIKSIGPDVVVTWLYRADLLGGIAAKLAGNFPVVWSARNSALPHFSIFKRVTLSVLSRFIPKRIIANGKPAYDFHKSLGYPTKKMYIIPNMLAPWTSSTKSKSALLNKNIVIEKLRIGIASRQVSGKGILETIRIVMGLPFGFPKIELTLIGQHSKESRMWEKTNLYQNLKVVSLNQDSELSNWFASLDLYLMSSTSWESQPNSLIEALAIGCPVLVSNHIQLDLPLSVVRKFDPTSQSSFEKSIRDLLGQSPAQRKEQAGQFQSLIIAAFSSESTCRTWIRLLGEVETGG